MSRRARSTTVTQTGAAHQTALDCDKIPRRTAVRTLCKFSRRTASGPEGSSAKSILCCAAGPPGRGRTRGPFRMSHLALARTWRPQRFEDVIGQRGVVETLKNAIATGRLAQAFIFAGPRGVGKTTTARILARALNCVNGPTPEPCGQCDACTEIAEGRDIDVMEIDGATYTGVDAVREVIVEPLSIAPMRDRFKIFIIDEVHRLSKSAFDALLKSIEEPPPYVKFMMATTDLGSVPVTIQSRSQVFELKALPFSAIREQLKSITAREGVTVDDGA